MQPEPSTTAHGYRSPCTQLFCKEPSSPDNCYSTRPAAEGSACGPRDICLNGVCTETRPQVNNPATRPHGPVKSWAHITSPIRPNLGSGSCSHRNNGERCTATSRTPAASCCNGQCIDPWQRDEWNCRTFNACNC